MAKITYTLLDRAYNSIPENENYSSADINLIDNYQINKNYNPSLNYIETHFYSLNNEKIFSLYDYNISSDVETDAEGNVTNLTLQPETISVENGFTGADHKIVFHFLNDLYTIDNGKQQFFINSISQDRKELLIYSDKVDVNKLINTTEDLRDQIKDKDYFDEYWLNLGDNDLFIITNIDVYELDDKYTIAIKLYEPLPEKFEIKHEVQIVEKVSDSCVVEIQVEVEEDPIVFPTLRQANFDIELDINGATPTEYFNYDELFSFSNLNSNREIFSYINEKSVEINIDHNEYENFINFSSATERLKNFKYKVQLLQTYESSKTQITGTTNNSGSSARYDNLIKGIIDNFDHYERFLYYESGSHSWPKSTTVKPHTNLHTTSSEAISWYADQLTSASNYDTSNYDVLTNTLPSYIAEDSNNNSALLFVHMIGQHFDNLWVYTKAVTDKYDNDNRLDVGISKDLVRDTLKSFGTKLYNSTEGTNDLFKYLIADTYDSGSTEEVVNTFLQVPNIPSDKQPIARKNYEGELYKRIYHNLPFLLKSKGTERGLRALINCFGIPSDFLTIKQYGGDDVDSNKFFGIEKSNNSSEDKIKYETRASGSVGKVLTKDKSIQKEESSIVLDTHRLEVGFSPADSINTFILSQVSNDFNIGDYIGDPRDEDKGKFKDLDKKAEAVLGSLSRFQLNDFVRLLKFYDNVLFKMIKDFVPAKATLDTGIIIKPHLLDRSKAKATQVSGTRPQYSASIDTAFTTGSHGGAYESGRKSNKILKDIERYWPSHIGGISNFTFKPDYSNPTTFNKGEIVMRGDEFYHPDGTVFNIPDNDRHGTVYTPYEGNVSADLDFYLMFSSESVITRFADPYGWTINGFSHAHPHVVPIDYSPHGQNSWVARDNTGSLSASFSPLASDVIIAAATLEAHTDLLSYFVNYTKPLNSLKPGEKSTLHKLNINTKSGSVDRWIEDESPQYNGELSGSYIEITDGELNDENLFKQVNVPSLNFNITPIDEGSAATYTAFSMDPTPSNDGTASCATNNSTSTYYHDGSGAFPLTVGDFVFTDIAGTTTFGGNASTKWYKLSNGHSIRVGGTNDGSNRGKVLETADCAKFDSTAPSGYTATWNMTPKHITAANKQSVPFAIYGAEVGATYTASAFLESTPNTKVEKKGTVTSATVTSTINTTNLADGSNVFLDVTLTDAAGNTGTSAAVDTEVANASLTASIKDTTTPTGYGVRYVNTIQGGGPDVTANNNGVFNIEITNIPSNEKGQYFCTITSTGGGSMSTSGNYTNVSGETGAASTKVFTMNKYQPGWNIQGGTVTATLYLKDEVGNQGGNVTDTLVYTDQSGTISGNSSTNSSAGTRFYSVNVTPNTLSWSLTDNASWVSISGASGQGDDSSINVYMGANSSSNSRSVTLTLTTGTTTLATKTITQAGFSSSSGCIAPFTHILMSDGALKRADQIVVGDEIRTQHETGLEWVNARIYRNRVIYSERIKVLVENEEIVVSPHHRFYVDNRQEYVDAIDLVAGDILSGHKYLGQEEYEDGNVHELSVEYAKTYISNNVLSHNAKEEISEQQE